MNKLIELFNKKYGDKYGKISYPRTTLQIYRVYQTIKSYGIEDSELIELLHKIELPKPRNTEEWELYVDCLYNKDDSELERNFKDVSNRLEILPVKNTHHVIQNGVPVSQQNITLYGTDYDAYMFNDEQITIPNNLELENSENKFSAICFDSKGLINAVVTYNDGTNDITKEVKLVSDNYFDSEPFNYDENGESGVLLMTFAFDSNTNKFYMVVATYSLNDNSVTSYEVKNVSLSYSYITNLIDDDYLKSINYSKIKNVPYQLNALVDGSIKALDTGEYASLFDNLFIWDANKVNERLDDTSGVKKNEYYDHTIKVKQKDSEGIGYGQYIPSSVMSSYKLFVSAGNDVIVKVYTRKHKVLLNKLSDFSNGEYQEITIHDSYSGTDGIFIAFTVKDSVTDFYANTYVSDLVLCKSSSFLTKQEVNNKVDKVNGKGLSTVDFTKSYETKLKGLENYNDTTIKKDIQTINTQLGDIAKQLESGNIGNNIEPKLMDMPRIYFSEGTLPTTKTATMMKFDYYSKTAEYHGWAEIKCQGNSSMSYPKKNFTIKLYKDKAKTEKLKIDFKGWGKQSKLVLKANWIDLTHARNIVSARIWGDIVKSRTDYSSLPELLRTSPNQGAIDGFPVTIYGNGYYQGRYTLNIPKDKWMSNMDDTLDTHCILCGENYQSGCFRALPNINGADWTDELHDTVPATIKTSWTNVIKFVMNSSDTEFKANLNNYIDVNSLIDYLLYAIMSTGLDAFGKNQIYMTYDGTKWFASMYDMDSTWGLWWNGQKFVSNDYAREDFQDFKDGQGNLLYIRLMKLFIAEIKARYTELRQNIFTYPYLVNKFEEFTQICPQDIVKEDYASTTANGAYTGIPSKTTNNIQQLRNNINARLTYVDGYINSLVEAKPCTAISLNKSELTLTGTGSSIPDEVIDITKNTSKGSLNRGSWSAGKHYVFGEVRTGEADISTDFIPFTKNNTLTITQPVSTYGCGVVAYDSNKNAIFCYTVKNTWENGDTTTDVELKDTSFNIKNPPENTAYIRICFNLTDLSSVVATKKYSSGSTSQEKLIATLTPTDTTDTVAWSVSPTGICTVDNGVVTPIKNGSCVITATCGSKTATCNVTVTGVLPTPTDDAVYTLPQAKTFNGTSDYVDTGIKLFDTNKDFTVFLDFTSSETQTDMLEADITPKAIFHCIKEVTPWAGIDVSIHTYQYSSSSTGYNANRGETAANKCGIFVNSISLGLSYKNTDNNKIAIVKSTSDNKVSVYDKQGKVGELTGNLVTTTFTQNALLGAFQNINGGKGRYWKGTINQCKIWFKQLTDDEITTLLGENTPTIKTFAITNNLTNCATSNTATSIEQNSKYSTTITPNSGCTLNSITVTMGGTDISSTAISNGVITINSVTGDLVITATATNSTGDTNLLKDVVWTENADSGIDIGTGKVKATGDAYRTITKIPCKPNTNYTLSNINGATFTWKQVFTYRDDDSFRGAFLVASGGIPDPTKFTTQEDASYLYITAFPNGVASNNNPSKQLSLTED